MAGWHLVDLSFILNLHRPAGKLSLLYTRSKVTYKYAFRTDLCRHHLKSAHCLIGQKWAHSTHNSSLCITTNGTFQDTSQFRFTEGYMSKMCAQTGVYMYLCKSQPNIQMAVLSYVPHTYASPLLSFAITIPKCNRLKLIFTPSLNLC